MCGWASTGNERSQFLCQKPVISPRRSTVHGYIQNNDGSIIFKFHISGILFDASHVGRYRERRCYSQLSVRLFVPQCLRRDGEVRYIEQASGHQWGGETGGE